VQSLGKQQCGISVPALVEGPFAEAGQPEQPEPRAAHFLETERHPATVAEYRRALETNPGLLLAQRGADRGEHVHLARIGFLRGPSAEPLCTPGFDRRVPMSALMCPSLIASRGSFAIADGQHMSAEK